MTDQKNTILAIVLSAIVLIAWQYFVGMPQMEKQKQEAQLKRSNSSRSSNSERPARPGRRPLQPGSAHRRNFPARAPRRRPPSS